MTSSIEIPSFDLPGEVSIPQFGLGVFQVPPEDTTENVLQAIELGYRHIDTAKAYGNEAEVGQAVRASGLDRARVLHHDEAAGTTTTATTPPRALKTSLGQLEMDHVDLYLIHWPAPAQDRYVETWRALIEAQEAGLARAIGVSNFQPDHLRRIIDETGVTPGGQPDRAAPATCSRPACAASTPTAASSPRPGARSRRARSSTTPRSPRSPRRTARPPPRSCCAGTSSSATSCSRSRSRPSGSRRTSTSSTSSSRRPSWSRSRPLDRGERTGPDPDEL